MTQPTPPATVTDPHKKITVVMIVGVVTGVLTGIEGFFGSGHIPSGAEVAAILGGSGVSLGTLGFGLLAHLGLSKAELERDARLVAEEWTKAEPLLATVTQTVPDLSKHLDDLTAGLDERIKDVVAAVVPAPVAVDIDRIAEEAKTRVLAAFTHIAGSGGSGAPAATGGVSDTPVTTPAGGQPS